MNFAYRIIRKLKTDAAGKRLFSIFVPALLLSDLFEVEAADTTRRVYRPTAAQLRVMQQQREQEARIQAIRAQQKKQNSMATNRTVQKTNAVPAVQTMQKTNAASTPARTIQKTNAAPAVKTVQQTNGTASPAKTVQQPRNVPPPQRIRYIWYKSTRFALVQDIARFYGMRISYFSNGVLLKSPRDTIFMQYNKRLASINKVSVYLTHAPLLRGALVYLDEKDFLLTIDPVIRNAPLWKHPLKTILIDPGHGGKDQGAPGVSGLKEKNITLKLGHRLAALLQKCGYQVFMTRIDDRNLTLQQRVAMCESLKPDLFISVHCNAVGNRRTMGIETYAATPQGAASTSDSRPVREATAGNSFNRNNYRLGYEVHKNLLAFTRAPDRGMRHARFFVIRNAVCPAILIETGFITHPSEGLLLNQAAYQEKLVNGIVSGVMAYAKASALPGKAPNFPVPLLKVPPAVKKTAAPAVKRNAVPAVKRPATTPVKKTVEPKKPGTTPGSQKNATPTIKNSTKIVKKPAPETKNKPSSDAEQKKETPAIKISTKIVKRPAEAAPGEQSSETAKQTGSPEIKESTKAEKRSAPASAVTPAAKQEPQKKQ